MVADESNLLAVRGVDREMYVPARQEMGLFSVEVGAHDATAQPDKRKPLPVRSERRVVIVGWRRRELVHAASVGADPEQPAAERSIFGVAREDDPAARKRGALLRGRACR